MSRGKLLFVTLFVTTIFAFAQTNPREHISAFTVMSFTYKHNDKWSAYLELQARSIEDFSKIDYHETKGGFGYNINPNHQIFIGTGKYATYQNSRISQEELRIWLQYVMSHKVNTTKLDHRIRLEKRFFDYPRTNTKDNTERYRYRLALTQPLNSKKMESGTLFANAFNEVFFGPKMPTFKRNRIFGGIGYVFSENISSNAGYMWQRDFSQNKNRNLHFLYFAVNFTFKGNTDHHHEIPVAD